MPLWVDTKGNVKYEILLSSMHGHGLYRSLRLNEARRADVRMIHIASLKFALS